MGNLSLEATISITTWSRRTWWRRRSEGTVNRVAEDARGRAMVDWIDVAPRLIFDLSEEDQEILYKADAGDAESQNDIGQLLASQKHYEAALYWIRQAADQEYPDAMQWLGRMYAAGEGVVLNENLATMWISRAAAHGHLIAIQQMESFRKYL